MRLTRAGEYAIRCALFLSYRGMQVIVTRKEIALAMDIPDQFLSKIAQQLARKGIIDIIQGPKGGYRLNILPEKLTMLDVVEAVIGKIYLNDCVVRPEACDRRSVCSVHSVWEKATNQLRETLKQTNFRDILAEENCRMDLFLKRNKPGGLKPLIEQ